MMRWTLAALAVVLIAGVASLYFLLDLGGGDSPTLGLSQSDKEAAPPAAPATNANAKTEGGLELCNDTQSHIGVAFGYKDKQGWASEGWWNVDPGACETVLTGKLIARFYYFYAVDYDKGGFWGGNAPMCTQDKLFTIRGLHDCEKRGYQSAGYFEVDTGEQTHWTVNLSGKKTSEK